MKLHWRIKGLLIGIGLTIPLLFVCGLTPAISYWTNDFPRDISPHFGADDGLMFQVWWRDFSHWITATDWSQSFLNISKGILVFAAVVAAALGIALVYVYLYVDDEKHEMPFHRPSDFSDEQLANKRDDHL